MRIFSFEKLKVWQKARQLSVSIYKLTKSFPDEERFGLILLKEAEGILQKTKHVLLKLHIVLC